VNDWWDGRTMRDMLPKLFFVHFRQTSFVAESDGRLVGFVVGFASQTYPDESYIHFAGVDPEFRKAGLGRALYERFFEVSRELGRRIVRCVTSPVNGGSIAFHLRMGFTAEPSQESIGGTPLAKNYDGPDGDRVLLEKK